MRHSLILFAAASVAAIFSFGSVPAQAAPLPTLDHVNTERANVEPVRYYRRRGYRPYRYWGPRYPRTYRYVRPYRYYYGPPYSRYYRNYGYYRRPYYGRRRYW